MLGMLTKDKRHPIKANVPSKDRSQFSQERYQFLSFAPFNISNACCNIMKKNPTKQYERKTGRHPITAQMACESRLRTQKWIQNGCNGFDLRRPISNPMSFWTEQDVLFYIAKYIDEPLKKSWEDANNAQGCKRRKARKYLRKNNYRKKAIASVYGNIVTDYSEHGQIENQMDLSQFGIFDNESKPLKTTGYYRTGCVFCGFGCHLDKRPNRFELIDMVSNPKLRDYALRGGAFASDGLWKPDNRGLGMWFVLQWVNVHGGFNIYIPEYDRYEREYGNKQTEEYLKAEKR